MISPKLIPFFIPFIFSISCTQKSFVCWNEKKTQALAFSFNETMGYVTVKDIRRYSTLTSRKKPLKSHMPGGTHTLEMNKDFITLKVIQDTVLIKTRIPSGKFIKNPTEIKTEYDYLNQKRYHAIYPIIHKYFFDKKLLKLSLSYLPLSKPRSAIEQEFIQNKKTNDLHPKKRRELTPEELLLIFPPHEKTKTYIYPRCEKEKTYSPKGILRSILKYFHFVYIDNV